MIRLFVTYTLLLLCCSIGAAESGYVSPVHVPIELAGNFGEPRPNHFHAGIDIKTLKQEGIGIYAIEGGYISKIEIYAYSLGRAIFITHPDGHISSYLHMRTFAPAIRNYVERKTGHKMSKGHQPLPEEECTLTLKPGELMVGQGELIGRSGDSGSSMGPHLHLELKDIRTGNYLDPLTYLYQHTTDHKAPEAYSIMIYPQNGMGTFNGTENKQTFGFTEKRINQPMTAWGKVGFGIWGDDYSELTYNRLGLRHIWLICDGDTVCHTDMRGFPAQMTREVNAWGDYEHYMRTHIWFLRSYRPTGVHLPFIQTSSKYLRGIVCFNEERTYNFKYILQDYYGNKSEYTFSVQGKRTNIIRKSRHNIHVASLVRPNDSFYWATPNVSLYIPPRNIGEYDHIHPAIIRKAQANELSDTYTLADHPMPLFRHAKLSIRLRRAPEQGKPLYLICDTGTWRIKEMEYKDGWATATIRELGATYYVTQTIPSI